MTAMHPVSRPSRYVLRLLLAGSMVLAGVAPAALASPAVAATTPAWDGSIDLYRKGVFTTQKTWLWCTAAGVQIVRNIVERDVDHSTRAQRDYFDWMRRRNRYDLPEAAGVDPAGWTAGLRHFVDDRYRLVASTTFSAALRSAVTRLRATRLPIALAVANGGHGWILTGFSATADPLVTTRFSVTSVRVVGPLYGRQSRNGYDQKPGTSLTPRQLRRFFTPWRYAPRQMVWDGKYVSIQPVPKKPSAAQASSASATPTASAAAAVALTPGPALTQPPAPTELAASPGLTAAPNPATAPTPATEPSVAATPAPMTALLDGVVIGAVVLALAGLTLALDRIAWRGRRGPRSRRRGRGTTLPGTARGGVRPPV